jgi:hypothetical protein
MPIDELTETLTTTTTRRTIVKTGVKLAYAVPIVAASFKLSARGVGALSAGNCTPENNYCTGSFAACGSDPDCICSNTSVGIVCHHLPCATCSTCTSDADCQTLGSANSVCIPSDDCCGGGSSCLTPCDQSCEFSARSTDVGTYGP